jgi:dienelactone hydrolase
MADTPDDWDALDDFVAHEVTYDAERRTVYRKGDGPAVIVISEIPGITPAVADFARRVVDLGCTVAMPSLFGEPGRPMSTPYAVQSLTSACVSKEFATWAAGRTSPVTVWLRHLARDLHDELGGPGVGVVGMCLTGGFALAMMVDDEVVAPVLSQPSLPFPVGKGRKRDLGISAEDLARVKERVDEGICVLGLRFTGDPVMPADRFARLREELGDGFVGVEIDSSKGNPHGIPTNAHSVLTEHLVDEPGHPTHDALNQVLDLFRERLLSDA